MILIEYNPRKSYSKVGRSLDSLEFPAMPSFRPPAVPILRLKIRPKKTQPSTKERPFGLSLRLQKDFNKNLDYEAREGLVFPRSRSFTFRRDRPGNSQSGWQGTLRAWPIRTG